MSKPSEDPEVEVDEAVIALLNRYKPEQPCPLCARELWEVNAGGSMQFAHTTVREGVLRSRPPANVIPFAAVSCVNCGYTFFMNIGLLVARRAL